LREILTDLGFGEVGLPGNHIAFEHATSDAFLAMPKYRSNQYVAPHQLIMVRMQLDARGILDADEFNERLETDTARRHA
jgi:hypothetical protein